MLYAIRKDIIMTAKNDVKNVEVKTVDPAIVMLCDAQLKRSEEWPTNLVGQAAYYPTARAVYKAIREGADFSAIQNIFKSNMIPLSFSGVGAWLPRQLHAAMGRIVDDEILIVKISGSRPGEQKIYGEASTMEMEGKTVNWDAVIPGAYVKCLTCDSVYPVKEIAHQGYCPHCESQRLKAKGGRGTGKVAVSKLDGTSKKMIAAAGQIIRLRHTDANAAGKFLNLLNEARTQAGKSKLTKTDIESAKSSADLLN
jgi:hypothetical protein